MKNIQAPIGIFDSGIGGLTVLKEIYRELPSEDLVYFGDTARVPYGTKSKDTISRYSCDNIRFLKNFDIKLVIVACNTASSLAMEAMKSHTSLPIIGVIEPGARSALAKTKNGRVGVIGTRATIGSGSYEACLKSQDPKIRVYSQACPMFVPLAEEGWTDGEIALKVAKTYLEPLKNFGIDTLILGCTHYPLLAQAIQKTMGDGVTLVNSAEETAREAKALLLQQQLTTDRDRAADMRFYVSDEPEQFRVLGERFLGQTIHSVTKVSFVEEAPQGDVIGASSVEKPVRR